MSILTPEQATARCVNAGELQEIAVFRVPNTSNMVDCVFWRTVITQRWICKGKPVLIGVFGGTDLRETVLEKIWMAIRQHAQ